MECLLIGGAQSVGKSNTIYKLAKSLLARGFTVVEGILPDSFEDFKIVIIGNNKLGKEIRIIINSPTDTIDFINDFREFYNHNGEYDILISSIRDDDFYPRSDFFRIMELTEGKNMIELPLGKITRRGENYSVALNWYERKIDELINHILINNPFNV